MATGKELKAELAALGVDAPSDAKKTDLEALIAEAKATAQSAKASGPGQNVADMPQPGADAGAGVA